MTTHIKWHTHSILAAALIASSGAVFAAGGDWLVRGRAISVNPDAASGDISTIPGARSDVGSDATLELDFSHMLSRNVGLELILATTNHKLHGDGILQGTEIGTTGVLPPTLTLQYHFTPGSKVRPYAGIGVNYTMFYDNESSLSGTDIDLDNSAGLAMQAGLDMDVGRGWFMNADVKYIEMNTTATLSGAINGTVDVDINPLVIGVGAGKRF